VAEVVELYFEDSAGKLDKLEGKLAALSPDFNDIDQLVHQFKGSSASFGAQKLAALCVQVTPLPLAFILCMVRSAYKLQSAHRGFTTSFDCVLVDLLLESVDMQTQAPPSIPVKRGLLEPKTVTEEGMRYTHMTCPRPGVMKGICRFAFSSGKKDCMQR